MPSTWTLSLTRQQAGRSEGRAPPFSPSTVLVDPYTGEVTGTRERGAIGLGRSTLLPTLYELHHDLFLGTTGHWLLAGAALVWLLMSLVGVYLAIRHAGGFWRALRVERRGSGRRFLLELHRSLGLATVIAVVVIALSGIYLNLRPEFAAMVGWFSPVSEPPERSWPNRPPEGPSVGWQRAIAQAVAAMPEARVQSITINTAKGVYRVRLARAGDVNRRGDTFAYVNMSDGEVRAQRDTMQGSAGDVFLAWLRPLHSGEALGLTGRWLVFAIGLLPAFLAVSGIYLWLRRKLRPRGAGSTVSGSRRVGLEIAHELPVTQRSAHQAARE